MKRLGKSVCMAMAVAVILIVVTRLPPRALASEDLDTLRKAVDALTERQQRLERQVEEMRTLLNAPGRAAPLQDTGKLALSIDDAPSRGNRAAKLVLVEFTDYQCPFCARHVRDTWPRLEREFVSADTLLYAVRDYPIERIHPAAGKAAEAAHCAGDQGKYWEMHDRLFANQRDLGSTRLVEHARAVGLEETRFRSCLDSGQHAARVRRDVAEGERLGVRGTPTFFLGVRDDGSTVTVLRVLRGALGFPAFKSALDAARAGL